MDTPMTVKALRDKLADLPDDMKVLVEGYESGYKALIPENINIGHFVFCPDQPGWEGDYDETVDGSGERMVALER